MKKGKIINDLARLAAISLGIIFLLAAFSKISDLSAFHKALVDMSFLPVWMKGMAVLLIPGLEVSLGIYLLAGFSPKQTALIASTLLVIFLGFGIYSNFLGHHNGCGCFKIALPIWLQLTGWWIVGRNIIFLALAGLIFWNENRQGTQENT